MTTATRADVHQTAVDQRRRLGWTHLAAEAAGMWVLYALLAFMVSSACEEALVDASGASGTAVSRLVSETLAEITRDHPGSTVSGILLLLAPAALIVATRRTREVTGQHWGEGLAWLGAFVCGRTWWSTPASSSTRTTSGP